MWSWASALSRIQVHTEAVERKTIGFSQTTARSTAGTAEGHMDASTVGLDFPIRKFRPYLSYSAAGKNSHDTVHRQRPEVDISEVQSAPLEPVRDSVAERDC